MCFNGKRERAQVVSSQVTLNLCCGSHLSTFFCALPVMFGLTSCQCMLCSSSRSPQEKRCGPQQSCLRGRKRNSTGSECVGNLRDFFNSRLLSGLKVAVLWPPAQQRCVDLYEGHSLIDIFFFFVGDFVYFFQDWLVETKVGLFSLNGPQNHMCDWQKIALLSFCLASGLKPLNRKHNNSK